MHRIYGQLDLEVRYNLERDSAASLRAVIAQALRPASIQQLRRHPNPERRLMPPGFSRAREHRHSRKSLSDAML